MQLTVHNTQCAVGLHDINLVGQGHNALVRIEHGQSCDPLQQRAQQAGVVGACVLEHHVGQTRIEWQVCEKIFKGF